MTKKLNESAVLNELTGQSAFFRRSSPPPDEPPATEAQKPIPEQLENLPVSAPVAPLERVKPSSPSSYTETPQNQHDNPPASTQASNQASLLASYHASIIETIRKTVKSVGKEVTFVRLTPEEKKQLVDIAYTYKRQGVKTSENEISRIAINFLLEDYKANGSTSILALVLASLLA
jgi:hypothetical protein